MKDKRKEISLLDAKGFRMVKKEKGLKEDESWYSIWLVWGMICLGGFSVLFMNMFFKIIGIAVIILGVSTIVSIYKQRREMKKEKGDKDARRK